MYEDKLAGVVTGEFWERKYGEMSKRREHIRRMVEEHEHARMEYLEDGVRILELAKDAYRLYVSQDALEQRKMLDILPSYQRNL